MKLMNKKSKEMKTLAKILHLSVLLLVLQARSAWGAETSTNAGRVGDMGDPARLSIEGVQTFAEGDIRCGLQADLDYLVASHPEATLAECLAALDDRVRAGYHYRGFPDVAVQARFDVSAGRIVAKVTEGPRFRCGALQVTGLKSIPVADFIRRFAERLAPASHQASPPPGIWKAGVPASFTSGSLANYSSAASNTFAALGRFAATFKVEIQPQLASGDAVLAVIVADEGPKALLQDIEVVGNKKNDREAVIGFLGLSNGMAITQDLIDEKARALTQAARFADSSITPTVHGPNGQVSLLIAVVENGRLPLLQQPLSREEKTLLRLREWFLAWESRQDDLIVDWSPPTAQGNGSLRIEAIVAPSGGIVARVMGNSPGQEELHDLYSIVIKSEALALFAQVHQRKLRIPLPAGYSGLFFVELRPCTNCTSGFSLNAGTGLSPTKTNTSWQLCLELLPAAFTDLLYRPGTKATWQGDVLTVRTEDILLRVEEGTGRLLELGSFGGKSTPTSGAGGSDAYCVTVRFTSGAFAKAVDQIAAGTSTHADALQSKRAIGSALAFITAELVMAEPLWSSAPGDHLPQQKAELASALEKLLASSCLDPFQTLLDEAKAPRRDEEFTIPTRQVKKQDSIQQMLAPVTVWCAGHAQELAPADSWLQTLLRESAFTLNSRTEHTPAAITRLAEADDLGPIGCFAVLHALPGLNQKSRAIIRERGLRRLTTQDFRRDYRMLLSPGSVITRGLANLTRELGTLKEPEVEAIAGLLPPDSALLVREMAAAARKTNNLPMEDVLGPALDRWWATTGRGLTEADFRPHSEPTVAAASGHLFQAAPNQIYPRAGILAVFNDRIILESDLREKLSPTVEMLWRQYSNNPVLFDQKSQQAGQDALEDQINDELVLAEAVAAGRSVPKEHLAQFTQEYIQTEFDGDTNLFLKRLAAQGTTLEEWQARHAQNDLVAAAWQDKLMDIPLPTPQQIEQYYQAHEQDFWTKERVQLRMIVLNNNPTNSLAAVESQRKLAAEIRALVMAGRDFAEVAQIYSQGSQKHEGGDWGWLERRVLRKELDPVAFSLKPGELSEVIETDSAFYIMKVTDRRPAALKPLAEVRADIEKTLKAQASSAVRKEWLGRLHAKAFLKYWSSGSAGIVWPENRMVTNEIKHIGPSTLNDAMIRSHLRLKAGELVTQTSVDHDIRSLYGTGDFYNIRVSEAIVDGGSKLIYYVQERPVLSDIQFTGNKNISSRELLPKLMSKAGERLDEWKLFNDSQTIQSMYQKAGYSQATVKSVPSINEQAGRGSVTFEVTEGLK